VLIKANRLLKCQRVRVRVRFRIMIRVRVLPAGC
jgi:hypothetical protein